MSARSSRTSSSVSSLATACCAALRAAARRPRSSVPGVNAGDDVASPRRTDAGSVVAVKISTSPSLSGSTWRPTSVSVTGCPPTRTVSVSPTSSAERVVEAAAGDRLAGAREHAARRAPRRRTPAVADRARLDSADPRRADLEAGDRRRALDARGRCGRGRSAAGLAERAGLDAHVVRLGAQRGIVDHAVERRLRRERGDERDHHDRQRGDGQRRPRAARERVLDAEPGGGREVERGGQPGGARRVRRRRRRGRARARRPCSRARRAARGSR